MKNLTDFERMIVSCFVRWKNEYNYHDEFLELRRELKKKLDEADHSVMRVGLGHCCCYNSSVSRVMVLNYKHIYMYIYI